MSQQLALVQALKNLPAVGQLVKDRGYRQVWRFEFEGKAYYLKWYPRDGSRVKRVVMGNPAMTEFARLLALQQAGIPSPRAIAVLRGFKMAERQGDAVILQALEPSIQLDAYLTQCDLTTGVVPDHRQIAQQLIDLVYRLGQAKLGHSDLHLGNILLCGGKLYLLDGYAVRNGGMKMEHLLMLGHSASRWATRADMVRGWRLLTATESPAPVLNHVSRKLCRKWVRRTTRENRYFGLLRIGPWKGHFMRETKLPRWWAPASALKITAQDWEREWPKVLQRLEADKREMIKHGDSGNVVGGRLLLGGREVEVVIKEPRPKTAWKQIGAIIRRPRGRRSWLKAWKLMIRGFVAEWPLLLMERRTTLQTRTSVFVVARAPGPTLREADLDSFTAADRERLFRRTGRVLRLLEAAGFGHFDAKSSNWIVQSDPVRGPVPVMVDVDSIRHYRSDGTGIHRLLRSMKEHPQYTRQDSLWLCQGYAPFARVLDENEADS